MGALARCESCDRAIRFVPTRKGKRMPLDPEPSPEGTVVLEYDDATMARVARVLNRGDVTREPTYVSHFATCPGGARNHTPDNIRRALERKRAEHGLGNLPELRRCSVHGCLETIARSLFVCRGHWRWIPVEIQRAILKYSQRGQVWDEPGPGECSPPLACRSAAAAALEAIATRLRVGLSV